MPDAVVSASAAGAGVSTALSIYAVVAVTDLKGQLAKLLTRVDALNGGGTADASTLSFTSSGGSSESSFDPSSILISLSAAEGAISDLQAQVKTLRDAAAFRTTAVAAAPPVQNAQASSSGLQAVVDSVSSKVSQHDGDISSLRTTLRNLQTSYETLKSLYSEVASRTGLPPTVEAGAAVVPTTFTAAEKSDVLSRLAAVENDDTLASLMRRATALEITLGRVVSDVTTSLQNSNANSALLASAGAALTALDPRVSAAEGTLATLSAYAVDTIRPSISALNQALVFAPGLTRVSTPLQCDLKLTAQGDAELGGSLVQKSFATGPWTYLGYTGGTVAQQGNYLSAPTGGATQFRFGNSNAKGSFRDVASVSETDITHNGVALVAAIKDLQAKLAASDARAAALEARVTMAENVHTSRMNNALVFELPTAKYASGTNAVIVATEGATTNTLTPATDVLRLEAACTGWVLDGSGDDSFAVQLMIRIGKGEWQAGVHDTTWMGRTAAPTTMPLMNAWKVTPGTAVNIGVKYWSRTNDNMTFAVRNLTYFFE